MKEPAKGSSSDTESGGDEETDKERVDRNLIELLNEPRVALPGVQVLFAFLLVAVMLVTDYVFSGATTIACVVGVSFAFLIVWYAKAPDR